jgi:hypothetical protein
VHRVIQSFANLITPHTHNVDKFLNLAYSLCTDLTHLERYERAEIIALQKKELIRGASGWVSGMLQRLP